MPALTKWQKDARRILRTQLVLKDMSYKDLARALENVGVNEDAKVLSNKVTRGTFSFAFFLQCMQALDVDMVKLRD